MKLKLARLWALCAALACVSINGLDAAPEGSGGGHHDHEETELGEQMETINKAFRTIRRESGDPANHAHCAELVGQMLAAAEKAKDMIPELAAEQPEASREKFIAGYQKEMKTFVDLLTQLEAAFKANDNEKATALVGKLRDHQRQSHREYKKPDED